MEYIKQNNPECLQIIQDIGCFFRSACHLAELVSGRVLSASDLNHLWRQSKNLEYINEKDDVQDSAKIANIALERLGHPGRFTEIGIKRGDAVNLYRWAQNAGMKPTHFIKKIAQNGKSKTHFVVVDENGKVIFEPHFPDIISRGEIYTICYTYDC